MSRITPTPEQHDAITAPLQPQLLVAGAGAGKTTVMALRILHLVEAGLVRPDQVLGLTFTNKAAQHLKEEVRAVLGPDTDITVATYHSYGASLVADHALELDLGPGTQVLNRAQSWQLLFAVFDEFRFERRATFSPSFLLNDALNLASRCADHLVPVEAVTEDCRELQVKPRWKKLGDTAASRAELCQVVAAYQRRKRERDLLDFGDQVALAVQLLTEHPGVAEAERQRHPVVLLDEYQDTNFAQRRLLQLVYPAGSAVTAVGDDMQSIYGFRGAHLANIQRFGEHFPPVTERPLQTTFRFGPALVALANAIQAQVAGSLEKTLAAPQGAPDTRIECFLAADDIEEADTIAAEIAGRGSPWASTAILCRKRRLIRPIAAALEDRGVPVEVLGASGLLDRPEVVDLVAWLEVLADPSASVALLRILRGPRYRIGLRDLAALARHSRTLDEEADSPLASAVAVPDAVPDLSAAARARLNAFGAERAVLAAAAARLPVLDLAETVILRTGLWQAAGRWGRENLLRFLDLAERFEPVEGDPGLPAFVEYLQLLDESEEDVAEAHPTDTDAVKVMTIHQAKGLQFDVVHVPGLAGAAGPSRIFPDHRAGENAIGNASALPWWLREDDEGIPSVVTAPMAEIEAVIRQRKLDEEWRLLYVACTRARKLLVCSAAHWYRGAAAPQGPSAFYDFVAGRTEVTERFRHQDATLDPDVAAKQRQQAEIAARYAASVAPGPVRQAEQLRLDTPASAGAAPAPARQAPAALSVTGLVTYARCPRQFYWTVVRPLPRRSSAAARIGTEVHRWIEQRAGRQLALIEPDAEDGAGDHGPSVTARLQDSFLAGPWAALDPVRVEAPFALAVGGHLVRGRIDAVYERDGRLELVDFKTGREAEQGDAGAGTQLDVYGLAALDTWGAEATRLRTTYCYLRVDGPPVIVSTDWDAGMAGVVRSRVVATLDRLAGAGFAPTPGGWCRGCDFLSFCPAGREFADRSIAGRA